MRNRVIREGMGYRLELVKQGVTVRANYIREGSDGFMAEVVVERAPEGHILRTRMNLLAAQTRAATAKQLGSRPSGQGVDWAEILEEFCLGVVEHEREGAPFVTIGRAPVRPEPPYLMRPMLFAGKPTILFGEGGVGKSSAVAAAVAVSVATGRPAIEGWHVVTPGAVLVLDWEGDADDWNDAVARVSAGMGIDAPALHYRRMAGSLDADVNTLASYVEKHGIVLVIVDSVTWATRSMDRAAGMDEPVKRLFEGLRHLGCASLLIDHKSKAAIKDQDETGSAPIGSIVKQNAARASYELRTAGPPSQDGTRHLALIARKLNPAAPQPPVGIAVKVQGDQTILWAEPVLLGDHIVVQEAKKSNILWERIRDTLLDAPLSAAQIVGRLGIDGKDPLRQVEAAMARKPHLFASNGSTVRDKRLWHLVMGDPVNDDASNVIPWPLGSELSGGALDNAPEHAPTDAPTVPDGTPVGHPISGSELYVGDMVRLGSTMLRDAPEHAPDDAVWPVNRTSEQPVASEHAPGMLRPPLEPPPRGVTREEDGKDSLTTFAHPSLLDPAESQQTRATPGADWFDEL